MADDTIRIFLEVLPSGGNQAAVKSAFAPVTQQIAQQKKAASAASKGGGIGSIAAGVAIGGPIGGALSGFLDKMAEANPAMFEMLGDAFADLAAVAGQVLLPVVKMLMPVIRLWGDFLASIMPSQEELNQLFLAFKPAIDAMREALQELVPVLKPVITFVVKAVAMLIGALAKLAALIYKAFAWLISGGEPGKAPGLKTSFGAAGRGASFVGIEQLGKNMMQSAFGGPGTLEQIADNTKRTADSLSAHSSEGGAGAGAVEAMKGYQPGA